MGEGERVSGRHHAWERRERSTPSRRNHSWERETEEDCVQETPCMGGAEGERGGLLSRRPCTVEESTCTYEMLCEKMCANTIDIASSCYAQLLTNDIDNDDKL